ncbi:MAG TPA: glycosyltransferase, partial [Solirubrobacteraceae bacterium]|nr:glycosyltransferase [Solirubrobacteraceae bacterium]
MDERALQPPLTIVAHDIGGVGGMERQLTDLIVGLRELGHPVTVIARTCELPPGCDVEFHRVRAPGRPFVLAYPWFLLSGSLAARRWRRGLVQATGAIVLGRVDVIAVHYCHQVGPVNPSRSTPLFRVQAALARVLKRAGERLCLNTSSARAIVCVSDGVAQEVREHFPRLAARVLTIHNGVDTDAFAPRARGQDVGAERVALELPREGLLAIFVGSEWERKGLAPAIRALARARAWTLVVVGAGERAPYEQLAEQLGVHERVRWLGVSADVHRLYRLADAFVLPSSYETFSLVSF